MLALGAWTAGGFGDRLARAVDFLQLGTLRHRCQRAVAPGKPEEGWQYNPESLRACVDFAANRVGKSPGW